MFGFSRKWAGDALPGELDDVIPPHTVSNKKLTSANVLLK